MLKAIAYLLVICLTVQSETIEETKNFCLNSNGLSKSCTESKTRYERSIQAPLSKIFNNDLINDSTDDVIECTGEDQAINVVKAVLSNSDKSKCPGIKVENSNECNDRILTTVIASRICNDKKKCGLSVDKNFGMICKCSNQKYLTVTYTCKKSESMTKESNSRSKRYIRLNYNLGYDNYGDDSYGHDNYGDDSYGQGNKNYNGKKYNNGRKGKGYKNRRGKKGSYKNSKYNDESDSYDEYNGDSYENYGQDKKYGKGRNNYYERDNYADKYDYNYSGDKTYYQLKDSNEYLENEYNGNDDSYGKRKSYGNDDSYGENESYGNDDSYDENESYGNDDSYGKRKSYGNDDSYGKYAQVYREEPIPYYNNNGNGYIARSPADQAHHNRYRDHQKKQVYNDDAYNGDAYNEDAYNDDAYNEDAYSTRSKRYIRMNYNLKGDSYEDYKDDKRYGRYGRYGETTTGLSSKRTNEYYDDEYEFIPMYEEYADPELDHPYYYQKRANDYYYE